MTVRITYLGGSALGSDPGVARITSLSGQVLLEDRTNPLRVSALTAQALLRDYTNPMRVTSFTGYALVSLEETPEESITLPAPAYELERNPFRPDTPAELERIDPTLDQFLREQQSVIRKQHNITQAGDTTYPWDLLTKLSPLQEFTLGSEGRFFHETYGMIHARYVQFSQMAETAFVNAPVGLFRSHESVDWTVTNDFSKSGPDLIVGIMTAYSIPAEGYFGWAVTDGANIATLGIVEYPSYVENPEQHQGFTWAATGRLGFRENGRIIVRQRNKVGHGRFDPGEAHIRLDGFSDYSIKSILDEEFESINEALETLQSKVVSLEGIAGIAATAATLAALKKSLATLATRLGGEERLRAAEDRKLRSLIGNSGITQVQLTKAIDDLRNQLTEVDNALDLRITAARKRADDAFALLNGVDITGINELLSNFNLTLAWVTERIGMLEARLPLIPLVNGDIPPQFVYLDDGNIVLVEISHG